jgi:predicted RNA polymerase sigma factor
MLFCDARRAAGRSQDGRYVPLSEQDPADWSAPEIQEAEAELAEAARFGRVGRFQLEAAIQSVHVDRARTGRTDWAAIVMFYDQLVRVAPTLGARVAQAAAVAEASGPADGLTLLDALGMSCRGDLPALLGRARAPAALARSPVRGSGSLRPGDRADRRPRRPPLPARPAQLTAPPVEMPVSRTP